MFSAEIGNGQSQGIKRQQILAKLKWFNLMKQVGIFEAKTHLSSLLDEVEKGGEVTITRHGKPVARLVQAQVGPSPEQIAKRRKALKELRAMAQRRGTTVSYAEVKSWIEEDRR
jgi:prevent-host-death family protein